MNLLWTLVYLTNILSYQNEKYIDGISIQKGHVGLFQLSRRIGSGKNIHNRTFTATHNPNTGLYYFNYKRFPSLDDMLSYILYSFEK